MPAQIIFNRQCDHPEVSKRITIESTSDDVLYAEAVSSRHELVSAIKSCGVIKPYQSVEINVIPRIKAFQQCLYDKVIVSVLIGNAKVEIPVKFVN